MSICSLVIFTKPENLDAVAQRASDMESVEVHARSDDGKLVVTVDHPDRGVCSETIMELARLDGVINTSLVYEYYE